MSHSLSGQRTIRRLLEGHMPDFADDHRRLTRRQLLASGAGTAIAVAGYKPALALGGLDVARASTLSMGQVPDITPKNIFVLDNSNFAWWRLVYNTLTELDHKTVQPKPALATSWSVSDRGRRVTLQLRNDVKFHTGRPFGPDDVVATIKAGQGDTWTAHLSAVIRNITDVSTKGSSGVDLRLGHPVTNLFDLFEMMPIIDSETLSGVADGSHVVGTGPFTFGQWQPGNSLTLAKNPHYWKQGLPLLDSVTLRVIPQPQALTAALQSGQVQMNVDVSPQSVAALKGNSKFNLIYEDNQDGGFYVACNVKVPPLNNKLVRQAIAWAIDRERILKQVFLNDGIVTSVPWAPSSPAWTKRDAHHYHYNPTRAKALLRKAGASGAKITLAISTGNPGPSAAVQIVQANLAAIGMKTQIVTFDNAQYTANLVGGKFTGLFSEAHAFGDLHPASLVLGALPFRANGNASNYSSPQYTKLVNRVWTANSPTQAKKAYAALTTFLLDQQFVIDVVAYKKILAADARLKGVAYSTCGYVNLDHASLA
jgi:peptide/nickel transport system substrate-binding protein